MKSRSKLDTYANYPPNHPGRSNCGRDDPKTIKRRIQNMIGATLLGAACLSGLNATAQSPALRGTSGQLGTTFEVTLTQAMVEESNILDIILNDDGSYYAAIIVSGQAANSVGLTASDRAMGVVHVSPSGQVLWFKMLYQSPRSNRNATIARTKNGDIILGTVRWVPMSAPGWCYKQEYTIARFDGRTGQIKWRRKSNTSSDAGFGFSSLFVQGDRVGFKVSNSIKGSGGFLNWSLEGMTVMGENPALNKSPSSPLAFDDGPYYGAQISSKMTIAYLDTNNGSFVKANNFKTLDQWKRGDAAEDPSIPEPIDTVDGSETPDMDFFGLVHSETHSHMLLKTNGMIHDGALYPVPTADKQFILYSTDASGKPLSYRRFYTSSKPKVGAVPGGSDVVVAVTGTGGNVSLERFGLSGGRKWQARLARGESCGRVEVIGNEVLCVSAGTGSNIDKVLRFHAGSGQRLENFELKYGAGWNNRNHDLRFSGNLKYVVNIDNIPNPNVPEPEFGCAAARLHKSTSYLLTRQPKVQTAQLSPGPKLDPVTKETENPLQPVQPNFALNIQQSCPVYVATPSAAPEQIRAFAVTPQKNGAFIRGKQLYSGQISRVKPANFSVPDGTMIEVERDSTLLRRERADKTQTIRRLDVKCVIDFSRAQ